MSFEFFAMMQNSGNPEFAKGHQPIIWHNYGLELYKNEKNGLRGGTHTSRPLDPPLQS